MEAMGVRPLLHMGAHRHSPMLGDQATTETLNQFVAYLLRESD